MNTLVNKFIRERIGKLENRNTPPLNTSESGQQEKIFIDEELNELLNRDEQQERAIVRSLLEFGLKPWDVDKRVADYLLPEFEDEDMFDNKNLIRILKLYKTWYDQKLEPTSRNFLYHEDQELGALVVSIMDFPYEVSENWKTFYEGKIQSREELYREEVGSTLTYLKLRKIQRLMALNQQDLEKSKNAEDQIMFMQTHLHLKQMEKELMGKSGTVIVKM